MVRIIRKRREPLSRWIEDNVRVPSGISAVSGPALSFIPTSAAVSVLKSASIGFTHFIVQEQSPILVDADRI